ncbi:hypothetical protein SISNIDRAFT_437964 [Sistotremastrum niveocremeum HHB9708]|uniref:Uncharacterized protein n=2 Tax=Sistotremastraceae TaxID=3402574 RepID=A0A164XST2_9AGAM|nr:hypothetical protein SISNIDRAFT_437964 [Sistotremastrum niveocremeum HHB9708]KZT34767.1 hypothetical protein SISSUDRAFT_1115044 [Sistotremastrum suecicum HHB10207 ss-3]
MSAQVAGRHPLSVVFLLHCALEAPLAVQALWAPQLLPLIQLNNTTIVLLKLYGALSAGTCLAAFLCFGLPEFLPGKRAFVISLVIYHCICSTVLINAPRIIPKTFGATLESFRFTPEVLWGSLHGTLAVILAIWWQLTLPATRAVKQS